MAVAAYTKSKVQAIYGHTLWPHPRSTAAGFAVAAQLRHRAAVRVQTPERCGVESESELGRFAVIARDDVGLHLLFPRASSDL